MGIRNITHFVVTTCALLAAACADDTADEPKTECVDRTETYRACDSFEFADESDYPDKVAQCSPSCGATSQSDTADVAALPAGECSDDAPACELVANSTCKCSTTAEPTNKYHCECSDKRWKCVILSEKVHDCSSM
jgi:hypothetical protein